MTGLQRFFWLGLEPGRPLLLAAALWGAGCSHKEPEAVAAPPAPAGRVGIALGDPVEGFGRELRRKAEEAGVDFLLRESVGNVAAQQAHLLELIDRKVSALLLDPIVPAVLAESRTLLEGHHIPLVSLGHGDGTTGSWVGLHAVTGARVAGERVGRKLAPPVAARTRLMVVEDSRWPESTRRVDEMLRGIESTCGAVEIVLRLRIDPPRTKNVDLIAESLLRMGGADAIVAGDVPSTVAALAGVAKTPFAGTMWLVGVSDDPARIDEARQGQRRLVLVAFTRAELAAQALAAVKEASEGKTTVREVPSEVVGGDAGTAEQGR